MQPTDPKSPEQSELAPESSLERPAASLDSSDTGSTGADDGLAQPGVPAPGSNGQKPRRHGSLLGRVNIYLLVFIGLLVAAGLVVGIAYWVGRRSNNPAQSQALTESTLKQLANSDVTVGQPKQILNVQSNAVFAGQVLVRSNLEVAGQLQVGGNLTLPNITVSGTSILATTQVQKNLSVAGDSALQGQLAVQKGLSVTGSGTFGGTLSAPQITVNTLQLNGDLTLTHHITAGGATPGRSNGPALGSGGSASVSGSDTAGSININTGSGAAAGCFVTINFTQRFNNTPHVLVTPIGAAAANVGYYVTRSTSNFSVCAANTPTSGASFGFDYFVLD